MDKKYEDSIHRTDGSASSSGSYSCWGSRRSFPAYTTYGRKARAQVITQGSGLLAVFIPTCIAEVFSYTPILGSSAYITFLTGNVMNLKVPVVVNAQIMSDTASGTEEGDAVATTA